MSNHKYILQPYKGVNTRYRCPECGKGKTFSRYIDTETGAQLADHVGKCNRLDNCSYHYSPKQYFQDNNISFDKPRPQYYPNSKPYKAETIKKPVSFIPIEVFKQSLKGYEANNFVQYLLQLFVSEITKQLIENILLVPQNIGRVQISFGILISKGISIMERLCVTILLKVIFQLLAKTAKGINLKMTIVQA